MTVHKSSLGRILRWLGFGSRKTAEDAQQANKIPETDRRESPRQRQMNEIAGFLETHHLEVNATTLTAAWNYLTSSDRDLVGSIDQRVQADQPVTVEWLEEELGAQGGEQMAALTDLMQRIESSIEELAKTSRDAHSATSEYHTALEGHVSELEQVTRTDEVILDLVNIAKVMLKRTRDIEKQMLRSEAQTRALKTRLDEARRNAEEDHLTGLPNRRAFEARFDEEYRAARANAESLCVAFCDIDYFKRINDEHGHDAGDRVLRLVAESLARLSDDRCHVARHGGEEFVVLLRGDSLNDAAAKLDSLRANLCERRLVNRDNDLPFGQVTFSVGIADVFACGDPRRALKAADTALYRAKQGGRNKVEIATDEDSLPAKLSKE